MGLFRRSGTSTLGEFEVEAFRAERLQQPLRQYEALLSSDRWADRFVDEVERTLTEGWKRGGLPRVKVEPPVAWGELCASNRSWQFHLQAWEPMSLVLSAYDHLGEQRYIDYCLGLALDWIAQYPSPAVDGDFAWYDMGIGLRAYRLGYLLDVVSRDPGVEDSSIEALAGAAVVHAQALAPEEGFRSHNNHGLYQAAGQVALASRFPELPTMGDGTGAGSGAAREHDPRPVRGGRSPPRAFARIPLPAARHARAAARLRSDRRPGGQTAEWQGRGGDGVVRDAEPPDSDDRRHLCANPPRRAIRHLLQRRTPLRRDRRRVGLSANEPPSGLSNLRLRRDARPLAEGAGRLRRLLVPDADRRLRVVRPQARG